MQKLWKQFEKHENFKIESLCAAFSKRFLSEKGLARARKNMCFTVVHFAGAVSYDGTNFMDKNMDELGELLKFLKRKRLEHFKN